MTKTIKISIVIITLIVGILLGKYVFQGKQVVEEKVTQNTEHWTCSMHPQIDLPEFGPCPSCGMDLIPMDTGNSNANPLVFEMTDDAMKLSNIQTTVIGHTTSAESGQLRLSGKIQADESKSASLVSHIPGRIEKLYVSFTGETVRKGQKLAKIYSPDLITAQKELLESKMMEHVNPILFEATLNKLKYWKISDKQIEEVLESREINESFDIYAEHSGVVSKRRVSVGDHLIEGGILFDIQNLNKLWVLFDVYEKNLKNIALNDEVKFTTPAVPGQEFVGKISFINPVINPNTRAATVRVETQNKNQILKPEMFVTGLLLSKASNSEQLTVPKSAVLWTGTRSVVYLKVPNSTVPSFEFCEVTLGDDIGDNYLVVDGLAMGDEVVTKGAFVIDASAQLNNQSSMMNRNVKGNEIKKILPNYTNNTPDEFKIQLASLVANYLTLKDNLVATNAKNSQESAKELSTKLTAIDMMLLKDDAHVYWMNQLKTIKENITAISNIDNIESQRIHFGYLSQAIIESVKVFGVNEDIFYVQFCPMAKNNEGAFWLSSETQIRNPYFGDVMMQCGTVEDTLR